jgi:hypothetical protein
MYWRQCTLPKGVDYSPIQETVSDWSLGHGDVQPVSLFVRTAVDEDHNMLLLSPGANDLAALLPGKWPETKNPERFGWSLLFGPSDSFERYGLRSTGDLGGEG